MSLFTVIMWTLVGLGTGILGFLALPLMAGPALPAAQAERLAAYYDKLAMKTAERLVNVRRQIGAYTPSPSSYDAGKESEKATLNGEPNHFADELGLLGTYHNQPFGFSLEGLGVIVDPFIASMTDYERPREEEGSWLEQDEDGNWRSVPEVDIPEKRKLAEIRNADYMIPGERTSRDPELAWSFYDTAQALFGRARTVDMMFLLFALVAGSVMGFVVVQYGAGGAPSVPGNVPTLPSGMLVPWSGMFPW